MFNENQLLLENTNQELQAQVPSRMTILSADGVIFLLLSNLPRVSYLKWVNVNFSYLADESTEIKEETSRPMMS